MSSEVEQQHNVLSADDTAEAMAREAGLPKGWKKIQNDFGASHSKYISLADNREFEHLEDALAYAARSPSSRGRVPLSFLRAALLHMLQVSR